MKQFQIGETFRGKIELHASGAAVDLYYKEERFVFYVHFCNEYTKYKKKTIRQLCVPRVTYKL